MVMDGTSGGYYHRDSDGGVFLIHTGPKALGVLIVDDEAPARQRLTLMLADHPDVQVLGSARNVAEAQQLLTQHRPSCLFLDVHMPGADGFRLLEGLPPESRPVVVFVTAHEGHARRAFDADAVDYLLKPYDDDRLAQALLKVRRALGAGETSATGDAGGARPAESESPAPSARPERFAVTIGRRTVFVNVADVMWVQADRNYVWLHTPEQQHLLRSGIGAMEALLDPAVFVRVHRSAIVRFAAVKEVRSKPSGDADLLLTNGTRVPVSERYRARLLGRT